MSYNLFQDCRERKYALLVVDMQERYFQEGKPLAIQRKHLTASIQNLLQKFKSEGWGIYFSKEEFKPDFSDAPLVYKKLALEEVVEGNALADIVSEFHDFIVSENVIVKKRHSSFEDTGLRERFVAEGITDVILAGINTDTCIFSACLAARMDFDVAVVRECVASSRQDMHDMALKLLAEKCSVVDIDCVLNDEY